MLRGFLSLLFAAASIRDCSINQNIAQITSLSIEPQIPVVGDNVTITVQYNLLQDITNGTVQYLASFNGIPFNPVTESLCSSIACPQYTGSYTQIGSNIIPDVSGKIVLTTTWNNQNNQQIWCVETTFRLTEDDL